VALGLRTRWRSRDHLHKTQDKQGNRPQTRARHAQARASMTHVQWRTRNAQAGEVETRTGPAQAQHRRSWSLLSMRSGSWPNPLCEARMFFARVLSIGCPDMSSVPSRAVLETRHFGGHVRSALAWPCAARHKAQAGKGIMCRPVPVSGKPLRCCLLSTIFDFSETPRYTPIFLVFPKIICNVRVCGEIVSVLLTCFSQLGDRDLVQCFLICVVSSVLASTCKSNSADFGKI